MKLSISIFFFTMGTTFARRSPFDAIRDAKRLRVLMSVKDGSFLDGTDSLDPTVDWASSTEIGGVEIDYGVRAAVSTKEGAERTAWAKTLLENESGWKASAKAEMDVNLRDSADIELDVLNEELEFSAGIDATISKDDGLSLKYAELEKSANTNILDREGYFRIVPRYDFVEEKKDIEISYESEAVSLSVVASPEERTLKLSRQMGDFMPYFKDAKYSLVASDKQDISFEYERKIDEDGSIKASFRPNDSAEIEWRDNGWVASAKSKLDGITPLEPDVSIKKDVSF